MDNRVRVAQALVAVHRVLPSKDDLIPGKRIVIISKLDSKETHVHLRWMQRNNYIYCPPGKRGWKITKSLIELAFSKDWMLDSPTPDKPVV